MRRPATAADRIESRYSVSQSASHAGATRPSSACPPRLERSSQRWLSGFKVFGLAAQPARQVLLGLARTLPSAVAETSG